MKKNIWVSILFLICIMLIPNYAMAKENTYVNVKIGKSVPVNEKIKITSEKNIYLITADQKKSANLNTNTVYVSVNNNKIVLSSGSFVYSKDFPSNGALMIGSDSPLNYGNPYRGNMFFKIINNKIVVINNVELESYLKGVVPNELSEEYPLEALKAQAITSRTFALSNINKYKKLGYNLDDTTNCQVYRGIKSEAKSTNKAVESTEDIVALYNDKIANTIFGASSGGVTASVHEVWGGNKIGYLSSINDPYSTKYTWDYKIKTDEFIKKLQQFKKFSQITAINIMESDSSGRVSKISIDTDAGQFTLKGVELRDLLGTTKLKSTLFSVKYTVDNIEFSGKGYGHGVGLSQYGAVEMAKQGKDCSEIMKFYFPGIKLQKK